MASFGCDVLIPSFRTTNCGATGWLSHPFLIVEPFRLSTNHGSAKHRGAEPALGTCRRAKQATPRTVRLWGGRIAPRPVLRTQGVSWGNSLSRHASAFRDRGAEMYREHNGTPLRNPEFFLTGETTSELPLTMSLRNVPCLCGSSGALLCTRLLGGDKRSPTYLSLGI
jgi:hypothetical protein